MTTIATISHRPVEYPRVNLFWVMLTIDVTVWAYVAWIVG